MAHGIFELNRSAQPENTITLVCICNQWMQSAVYDPNRKSRDFSPIEIAQNQLVKEFEHHTLTSVNTKGRLES